MFQNLNEKWNKESDYIAIQLQPRFNCAISRICEYYFIDRQDKYFIRVSPLDLQNKHTK
jgi:hypothetical protein